MSLTTLSAEMAEVGRVKLAGTPPGRLKVSVVRGDVRKMHRSPENASALFQVASQFNLLEMRRARCDAGAWRDTLQRRPTQGPACAITPGAATIYRNYFALRRSRPDERTSGCSESSRAR